MTDVLATWINGVEGGSVPADDRGLQYGDGVFETLLVRNGVPRFLAAHRDRMRRGLAQLGIRFLAGEALDAEIARAAGMAPPLAVLKIIVTRGSAARRGYRSPETHEARRIMSLWPTAPLANDLIERGVDLDIARLRVPTPSPFAGLKHLNRLENVMASTEASADEFFDALLMDTGEQLVSGTSCNVFLVKAGQLLTPPVDRAGVAGVMRAVVLREARRLAIGAHEQQLTMSDLIGADGIFITNARIGVVPVRRVREHVFAMTDVVSRLRAHIEALDA
jgi:4-amino-4-deoxychorismate lyase